MGSVKNIMVKIKLWPSLIYTPKTITPPAKKKTNPQPKYCTQTKTKNPQPN